MDRKNLIALTNLINKLPMEAIDKLLEIAKEQASRFLPAKIRTSCPLCDGKDIVKNGHKCGKQEYKCKCCGHTFVSTTNTMMANSRQPMEIWEEVIHDTLDGNSIDFTAERTGLLLIILQFAIICNMSILFCGN